ncbi:MAG TPA: PaaI family thioesterase [Acidimicrobiales bacterium]|jgi:acyl-coenzyme A thioesterase PaaI-like protein|nr:PaaI family thioesterase [Acidimicrobiales bacterium]|tara:strand:- start:114 stop:752 length:639 start_codon:yes stop_codon:yes gene_type:complete
MSFEDQNQISNHRIAHKVRALIRELHTRVSSEEALQRIETLLDEAQMLLEGPTRIKWYEVDVDTDEETTHQLREEHRDYSLFRGESNPLAPPIIISKDKNSEGEEVVVGEVSFDQTREGPPRAVHGGMIAAVFDDVLSGVLSSAGATGSVTGKLTIRYRRPTPIDTDLRFEAWIDHQQGRRLTAQAHCLANGEVTAEAEALFVRIDMKDFTN